MSNDSPALLSDFSGYSNVDSTTSPERYVQRLDATASHFVWKRLKLRSYALLALQPGNHVLDVGCGTGDDVRAMAESVSPGGMAAGLDCSMVMIDEAERRTRRPDDIV